MTTPESPGPEGGAPAAERLRRPAPERIAPRRNGWSQRHRTAADGRPAGGGAAERVQEAVAMAYGLIDDNLAHGQAAAERLRSGRYDAGDAQEDLTRLAGRLLEATGDLSRIWMEFLGGLARDSRIAAWLAAASGPSAPVPGGAPAAPPPEPPARPAPPLVLRAVIDGHPGARAEDVVLAPAGAPGILVVDSLKPRGAPAAPAIAGVVLAHDDGGGPVRAIVHVPPGQPPGLYDGVVHVAGQTQPLGLLTLVVDP